MSQPLTSATTKAPAHPLPPDVKSRARAAGRARRVRELIENPDYELWYLRVPSAVQLREKLPSFKFAIDNDGKVAGSLLRGYQIGDLPSINARIAYPAGDGKLKIARPFSRVVGVMFRSSAELSEAPPPPAVEPVKDTVPLAPRFPVGKYVPPCRPEVIAAKEELEAARLAKLPEFERVVDISGFQREDPPKPEDVVVNSPDMSVTPLRRMDTGGGKGRKSALKAKSFAGSQTLQDVEEVPPDPPAFANSKSAQPTRDDLDDAPSDPPNHSKRSETSGPNRTPPNLRSEQGAMAVFIQEPPPPCPPSPSQLDDADDEPPIPNDPLSPEDLESISDEELNKIQPDIRVDHVVGVRDEPLETKVDKDGDRRSDDEGMLNGPSQAPSVNKKQDPELNVDLEDTLEPEGDTSAKRKNKKKERLSQEETSPESAKKKKKDKKKRRSVLADVEKDKKEEETIAEDSARKKKRKKRRSVVREVEERKDEIKEEMVTGDSGRKKKEKKKRRSAVNEDQAGGDNEGDAAVTEVTGSSKKKKGKKQRDEAKEEVIEIGNDEGSTKKKRKKKRVEEQPNEDEQLSNKKKKKKRLSGVELEGSTEKVKRKENGLVGKQEDVEHSALKSEKKKKRRRSEGEGEALANGHRSSKKRKKKRDSLSA